MSQSPPARQVRDRRIGSSVTAMADERIPARLLAIATDHIRRFGAARVTVVAVAEEAGMSHANVYRFFASKAALDRGRGR